MNVGIIFSDAGQFDLEKDTSDPLSHGKWTHSQIHLEYALMGGSALAIDWLIGAGLLVQWILDSGSGEHTYYKMNVEYLSYY